MPSVENRIVKMEFDNAAFERKVAQTLASLSGLDKALKMTGATKGLADVSAAAKKVDFSPINTGLQRVSASFLALSTIAVTALATVTHAAISAGGTLVKSLSLDQVLDGFKEYELNIGSIQTILANTRADATTLEDVNAALDELNDFSDKTIYNFGQMTKNIGTFTAAGVDLDTSVNAIKGISNLAAISGSSAEQASTAMYQLSQAVSTGTLRLIDWNSVVNAGMGGEVFQKALFETGVAMHTIVDAPVGTTFEEWKEKGNNFRDSLQDGWLTGEVLTNTLAGFTGDLTEAQLLSIGYTKQQAAEILELGRTGVEAATKIRTLSQLMNTIKETVASGWSETFRTVFGNFEEASDLFTNVNNAISNFVKTNAQARNELLNGWKEMGGRDILVRGLGDAFKALQEVVAPIKEAFRDIFPAATSERLFELTERFGEFAASLRPSEKTVENLGRIFKGLFSVLDIGIEVVKGVAGFVKDLVLELTGLGQGNITEFTADIADFFTNLREGLAKGEGIKKFFDALSDSIPDVVTLVRDLKDAFLGLFDGFDFKGSQAAEDAVGRIQDRFSGLAKLPELFSTIIEGVSDFIEGLSKLLSDAGEALGGWWDSIVKKVTDAIGPGDFDAVLDALNVSLLGGIALILGKFLKGGINLDIGDSLLENVSESFQELTGVLKAMQTQLKVDTLLKIATAVGVLTASVVALSLVDSAKLAPAMATMAAGFAELLAVFVVISAMNTGVFDAASFTVITTGMIALASAMIVMAGAVALFGTMDTETLAKGLSSIAAALTIMTTVAIVMSKNAGSFILASVSLGLMAGSLILLSSAVGIFGTMEWETLEKGFAGVAAGLGIIAIAMRLMPTDLVLRGAGLILIASALTILAGAVAIFGNMEWDTLGRGMAGLAGGLVIIAGAMQLMPPHMFLIGAGLVVVGIALNIIAKAMKSFSGMSWEEIGKGLAAIAGALIILTVAMHAMQSAIAGAFAMIIVAGAMAILAGVLVKLAEVPFGDLVKAIGAIAVALAVFGAAAALLTPVIPALLSLGLSLLVLGAAFALIGLAALEVATALEKMAKAGPEAGKAIVATMEAVGKGLPKLLEGLAEGIIDFFLVFVDALPVIIDAARELIGALLDLFVELLPKIADTFVELGKAIIQVITELGPDLIELGIFMLIQLLTGIRDNIFQVTELIIQIVIAIVQAFTDNADLITTAGADLLVAFVDGISENSEKVNEAVAELIKTFIESVASASVSITEAGAKALVKFVEGISNNASKVTTAATNLMTSFISGVASSAGRVATSATDSIIKFASTMQQNANRLVVAGVQTILSFLQGIGQSSVALASGAVDVIITFLNALADVIRRKSGELRAAGLNVAAAIIDGITGGILSKAQAVADKAVAVAKKAIDAVKSFLGINSPSKLTTIIGGQFAEGFGVGMDKDKTSAKSAVSLASRTTEAFNTSIAEAMAALDTSAEFNPTITPVIDLTRVRAGASAIGGMMSDVPSLSADVSFRQANVIAATAVPNDDNTSSGGSTGGNEVKFEQNIYAPTELSTGEIYRNTRNQITLAKEELNVA